MTEKKSITAEAQKDFDDKTAAVMAAEASVEQAQQSKIKADAKTLDASDADLDKALLAQAVAAGKVGVLQQRLAACKERLAAAAAALGGLSVGLLRKWRAQDESAVALGRDPAGPPWKKLGDKVVVYPVTLLRRWLAAQDGPTTKAA